MDKKYKAKPTPEMLGSGMANKAASKLRGRKRSLDEKINAASGGKATQYRED